MPAVARALASHLAESPDPRVASVVLLRNEVEAEIESMTEELFLGVERDLDRAREAGELDPVPGAAGESTRFDYDTRLVMPAVLTLGRIHAAAGDVPVARLARDVDRDLVARGRETTRNVVRALLDGDMRDAINDDEYEDFESNLRPRETVAEIAQRHLEADVESWLDRPDTPEAVRASYDHAVELSERHQDEDDAFRGLLDDYLAADGPTAREAAGDAIRERYRVGILYEDMLNMYEADLGTELGEGFKRAVVLMVIGAQIGLDDTDDYPEDRGSQLTPVTAELNLADDRESGIERVRAIVEAYLDRADACADSDDHLTRIAIEYIRQQSLDRIGSLSS
jgi:hypothetical protein